MRVNESNFSRSSFDKKQAKKQLAIKELIGDLNKINIDNIKIDTDFIEKNKAIIEKAMKQEDYHEQLFDLDLTELTPEYANAICRLREAIDYKFALQLAVEECGVTTNSAQNETQAIESQQAKLEIYESNMAQI